MSETVEEVKARIGEKAYADIEAKLVERVERMNKVMQLMVDALGYERYEPTPQEITQCIFGAVAAEIEVAHRESSFARLLGL